MTKLNEVVKSRHFYSVFPSGLKLKCVFFSSMINSICIDIPGSEKFPERQKLQQPVAYSGEFGIKVRLGIHFNSDGDSKNISAGEATWDITPITNEKKEGTPSTTVRTPLPPSPFYFVYSNGCGAACCYILSHKETLQQAIEAAFAAEEAINNNYQYLFILFIYFICLVWFVWHPKYSKNSFPSTCFPIPSMLSLSSPT